MRWFEEPVSSDNLTGAVRGARTGAHRHGYRRRRVWLYRLVLRAHAAGQRGHRFAGGCNSLRRHQRVSECRLLVLGCQYTALVALRAQYASPCLLRCSAGDSHGVFSRSCPHRADVLRWILRTCRRRHVSRSFSSRNGADVEGARRSAVPGVIVLGSCRHASHDHGAIGALTRAKEKRCGEADFRSNRGTADRMGSGYHFWFSRATEWMDSSNRCEPMRTS